MLGSSAAWPIPRLGCDCEQCTSSDPRDRRLRSSLLVDGRILVDAGPDAYQQLLGAGVVPEAILLTHHHHDHMLGLHVLSKAGRLPLHMTKEAERGVRTIFPRLDFRVMHLTPGVHLELGNGLVAQAFDVAHSKQHAHGRVPVHHRRGRQPGLRTRHGRAARLEAGPKRRRAGAGRLDPRPRRAAGTWR